MKYNLTSHLDDWKFIKTKRESFLEKFDIFIIVLICIIVYFMLY